MRRVLLSTVVTLVLSAAPVWRTATTTRTPRRRRSRDAGRASVRGGRRRTVRREEAPRRPARVCRERAHGGRSPIHGPDGDDGRRPAHAGPPAAARARRGLPSLDRSRVLVSTAAGARILGQRRPQRDTRRRRAGDSDAGCRDSDRSADPNTRRTAATTESAAPDADAVRSDHRDPRAIRGSLAGRSEVGCVLGARLRAAGPPSSPSARNFPGKHRRATASRSAIR